MTWEDSIKYGKLIDKQRKKDKEEETRKQKRLTKALKDKCMTLSPFFSPSLLPILSSLLSLLPFPLSRSSFYSYIVVQTGKRMLTTACLTWNWTMKMSMKQNKSMSTANLLFCSYSLYLVYVIITISDFDFVYFIINNSSRSNKPKGLAGLRGKGFKRQAKEAKYPFCISPFLLSPSLLPSPLPSLL